MSPIRDSALMMSEKIRGLKKAGHSPCIVVMVGLPARGKTCMAHKLQRYLSWTNHQAKVFSVSDYRRKVEGRYSSHEFFRAENPRGRKVRERCTMVAMQDAAQWLKQNTSNSIAILDGNHATEAVRMSVLTFFKQISARVLFIECISEDIALLERNILDILCRCEDYRTMEFEEALEDFQLRLEHYIDQYSPLGSSSEIDCSYIKFYEQGEDINIHRLSGPLQERILNFITNYSHSPKTIYLSRHGESEYNVLGRIGGNAPLSNRGLLYAKSLAQYFNVTHRVANLQVWISTKMRTHQTAQHIDANKTIVPNIDEIDAGVCEGLTYEEIAEHFMEEMCLRDEDKLRYRYPNGESYVDIMERLTPSLLDANHQHAPLLIVSHQAVLRAVLAYFIPVPLDEIPYINIPLHTVIKLTPEGYNWSAEFIRFNIDCTDTYRKKPQNCTLDRSMKEALETVPDHLDSLSILNQ